MSSLQVGTGGVRRAARRELHLNLSSSPPVPAPAAVTTEADGHGTDGDSDSSSPSSCVSSDGSPAAGAKSSTTMVIGACTRCLMYCMVARKDFPTCINCKQPCLVDLLHGEGRQLGDDAKRGKRK